MADKNQIEPETMGRAELIRLCSKILTKLDKKISGRYRPNDNENLYFQAVRALSGLIDTTNRILKDSDLEELEHRLAVLEGKQENTKEKPVREFE
ncbi:MAG: hypothetical protein KAW93_09175 [Methanogenium sp.]|nr:hypothetical protein [Methanogenium sp.]